MNFIDVMRRPAAFNCVVNVKLDGWQLELAPRVKFDAVKFMRSSGGTGKNCWPWVW
jgi:hypothetical protein